MRNLLERTEDIIAGLVTGGIGIFIMFEASTYRMGTLYSMGPGYFPVMLGAIMVALAVAIMVTAQPNLSSLSVEGGQVRGTFFLAAAFGAFALTIENQGLIVAVFLAVFLSAMANIQTRMVVALGLAVATALVSALIFRVGLGLQIEAF